MRFLCTNCGYIYDESLWDEVEWIEAWTKFYELKDSFKCPVCWEREDFFQEIIENVNYIEDSSFLSNIEKEHFINIEKIDSDKIRVSVGLEKLHPSEKEHFISEMRLLDEEGEVIEEEFLTYWEDPVIDFDISWLDNFEIVVRCNVHWLWWRKISL